ncbi:MAG: LapA family protein [Candidatus Omnitrophota bacterium]
MNWKIVLVLILLSLLAIFTAQNYDVIEIKFLIWSLKANRALIIFATLCIGVVIGWVISAIGIGRGKRED